MAQSISVRSSGVIKRGIKRLLGKPTNPRGKQPSGPRLSLVVAAYNVEAYIDRFLASVFGQSSMLQRFEVIIVDDGSTDDTAKIVRNWQSRHPKHLRYVYQENAGPGAARNTGLALACGEWVGFPDSDDFLDVDYIRHMLKETEVKHKKKLLAVVSNLIFYHESSDEYSDTHPLRYRFSSGVVRKLSHNLDNHMQLSGATIWVRRQALMKTGVKFDTRVVPGFEDAHFINRLFIYQPDQIVSFLPKAKYYYRKRSAQNSLLDGTKVHEGWYRDQIKYGSLDLLKIAKSSLGSVPLYIQRTCLYDIFWKFRYLVDFPERAALLTDIQKEEFISLVEDLFQYIDSDTIKNFNLAGCTEEHKVALLAIYKKQRRSSPAVYIHQMDQAEGMAQFSTFCGGDDEFKPKTYVNGVEASPTLPSERRSEFLGMSYYRQQFFWIQLDDGDDILFEIDGNPCRIRRGRTPIGMKATWLSLRNALQPSNVATKDPETQRLRNYVLAAREKYRGGRILMDSPEKADDNAEHLYRHLITTGQDNRAWFILSESSSDWPRLEKEGFRLLPFGSDDHIAAQLNADFFISSHADNHVVNPVPEKDFSDLRKSKYIFLQHGVANNDLSRWLNGKPIRLFVTTMPKEYASIAYPNTPYVFTSRETILSGLPRHDRLLSKSDTVKADSILIMPTWRKYLTEAYTVAETGQVIRGKSSDFFDSDFARNWEAVLESPFLEEYAKKYSLRVVFAPHPNMAMYMEDMSIPAWIEQIDVRSGVSYQDLFASARVAISDYSSAITDVAFLQRPIIYFQFDADEMFSGNHVCRTGSFSHVDDGFGPVVETPKDVLSSLEKVLQGQEDPIYSARRQTAFPHRDGRCCERVCTAIAQVAECRPRLRFADGPINLLSTIDGEVAITASGNL